SVNNLPTAALRLPLGPQGSREILAIRRRDHGAPGAGKERHQKPKSHHDPESTPAPISTRATESTSPVDTRTSLANNSAPSLPTTSLATTRASAPTIWPMGTAWVTSNR